MEQPLLQRFNADFHTKDAVLDYIVAYFESEIIQRAYKKQDVASLADAVIEVKNAFEKLKVDYGTPDPKTEDTNQAA